MSTQILFSKSKVSTPKMTSESIIDKKSHGHEIGDIPRCSEAEHIDKTPILGGYISRNTTLTNMGNLVFSGKIQ